MRDVHSIAVSSCPERTTGVKKPMNPSQRSRVAMTVRRRLRGVKLSAAKRTSERRSQSIFLVVIFFAFFACIILTEVFLVDRDDGIDASFWNKLGFDNTELDEDIIMAPRIARELARVVSDVSGNESSEYAEYDSRLGEDFVASETDDHWQSVHGTKDKFFVFSAYYDDRKVRTIRIVAAARTRMADRVACVFYFHNGGIPATVYATNKLIRENWNLRYSAYFVLCPLRRDIARIPDEVSVIKHGTRDTPSNRLVIHKNRAIFREPKGIAVCVKPLHYNYNKLLEFVEFIELNRILGVGHFFFYNHTTGPELSCAINHYAQQGLLSLLPWNLNMLSQKEIRTEGLFAALNDCLYRTMYRYRFVLMVDLDEFIVPHSNSSLSAMLSYAVSRNPNRIGALSFQNAFFYLQWPNDPTRLTYPLITLEKTKRKAKLHSHKQRSKCIVLPEKVVEMGNHFVWEFTLGKVMQNVHPDTGFLHHYRVCEFGGSDCINTTYVVDRRMYKWKDSLLKSFATRIEELKPICQLPTNVSALHN